MLFRPFRVFGENAISCFREIAISRAIFREIAMLRAHFSRNRDLKRDLQREFFAIRARGRREGSVRERRREFALGGRRRRARARREGHAPA